MEIFMGQIPLTILGASATDNHHPWYDFIFDGGQKLWMVLVFVASPILSTTIVKPR